MVVWAKLSLLPDVSLIFAVPPPSPPMLYRVFQAKGGLLYSFFPISVFSYSIHRYCILYCILYTWSRQGSIKFYIKEWVDKRNESLAFVLWLEQECHEVGPNVKREPLVMVSLLSVCGEVIKTFMVYFMQYSLGVIERRKKCTVSGLAEYTSNLVCNIHCHV